MDQYGIVLFEIDKIIEDLEEAEKRHFQESSLATDSPVREYIHLAVALALKEVATAFKNHYFENAYDKQQPCNKPVAKK